MPDNPAAPKPSPHLFKRPATTNLPSTSPSSGIQPASSDAVFSPVAGPLSKLLTITRDAGLEVLNAHHDANALIILRRVALRDSERPVHPEATRTLLAWATKHSLGMTDPGLVKAIVTRRAAAIRRSGQAHTRLRMRPLWRLLVGSGERTNPHEIGLSLHGTTGWPIIPGSSLKGLAAAWAREEGVNPDRYQRIFGHSIDRQPGEASPAGRVNFHDGLPCGRITIRPDVVNPHFGTEWANPIPVHFLTIGSGSFEFFLTGTRQEDCDEALDWCREGIADLGVGAKTGAGYGYMIEEDPV